MKKITIYLLSVILFLILLTFCFNFFKKHYKKPDPYLYFGRRLSEEEYKKIKQENEYARNNFPETVRRLNQGWDLIRRGNEYYIVGQYKEAAAAYEEARIVDPSNYVVDGHVVDVYEKLGRYDEAIGIVDNILKKDLAEIGVKRYTELRARLLAAKAAQQKTTEANIA